MTLSVKTRTALRIRIIIKTFIFLLFPFLSSAQPVNDLCVNATSLTSATTCTNTNGTLLNATASVGLAACGNAGSADVWYSFVAQTAYPIITLSSLGASLSAAGPRIQLFSGACALPTSLACTTSPLNVKTAIGGAGLTPGNTYLIRITTNTNTGKPTSGTWTFRICVTDPAAGSFDYSKSYVNLSKKTGGGTVNPGDILEIRATFVVASGSADSLAFYDTLYHNAGKQLNAVDSLCTRTNEGKCYNFFTDAHDGDAGWYQQQISLDTVVQINIGTGASGSARGKLLNTSKPSYFTSKCIIMATYRVQVYGAYNTKINFGGGSLTYRDAATGVMNTVHFKDDSIMIYQSPGLCPNAVAATNAVGVEFNGTFGAASGGAPITTRNRGTSAYVSGYTYQPFMPASPQGPQDYYYGITNNTSAKLTTTNTIAKPDPGSVPNQNRVFAVWDITGDHTGAVNTALGNPPCDTTKPVSATNPCGYMLVINSSFKTDTAFQYTVTSLCPNTYYEISAWFKNICSKCACDSNGKGASNSTGPPFYIPTGPGDSSGVVPNLAFDVNGIDYYTTGDITHQGLSATEQGSDSVNTWVKRGFVYKTDTTQNSFTLTIRNNAPGGGGNDWAVDDIAVATCLPNMQYSPSLTPNVCRLNPLTIDDTIRSYFDNYVYYKWQRSTDGGTTWTDVTGPLGPATPTLVGSTYQYITSYTIPPAATDTSNNGDLYRVIVATTSANLATSACQFTDGVSIINLVVNNCGIPLKTDLLSFNGKLINDKGSLSWTTSKEDEPVIFTVERSNDGNNFLPVGTVNSHNNYTATVNSYSFADPAVISGKVYYRLYITDQSGARKYSRTIQLRVENGESLALTDVINPFSYSIDFDITSQVDTKIEVELIDLFGKTVQKKSYQVRSGVNALSMPDTQSLPAGTYIFRIKNNEVLINRKVLKKNL